MTSPPLLPSALPMPAPVEDPLVYLPCSTILEFWKGQLIYDQDPPNTNLYLVVSGKVKVSWLKDDGQQVVIDIYQADEVFGESALLGLQHGCEHVTAIENTRLMMWSKSAVEELILKWPRLGLALIQILVQRTAELKARVESFAVDNIERRLARTLIRYSERLGVAADDGSVRMMPFTHELLARHVGTSREIITHYMIQFRRRGQLEYSRKAINLHPEALREWLGHSA